MSPVGGCTTDGCERPIHSKHLCESHYYRARYARRTPEQRVAERLGGCLDHKRSREDCPECVGMLRDFMSGKRPQIARDIDERTPDNSARVAALRAMTEYDLARYCELLWAKTFGPLINVRPPNQGAP